MVMISCLKKLFTAGGLLYARAARPAFSMPRQLRQHLRQVWRTACVALVLATQALFGAEGYYWGSLEDGRKLGLIPGEHHWGSDVHIHVEGEADFCTFDAALTNRATLCFTNGMRAREGRWPFVGLALDRVQLPRRASGHLFLRGEAKPIAFVANLAAPMKKFSRERGMRIAGRGGSKEFSASWPDFQAAIPLQRDVSKLLSAGASKQEGQFMQGSLGLAWEGLKDGGASWDWSGSLTVDGLVWVGTNLVSVQQIRYEDTGGAHGMGVPVGRNFVLLAGKAREFALKDLFRADAKWPEALSVACLRELRHQQASSVLNGEVKAFKPAEMESFNVDGRGLMIHFAPYSVGSYAEGIYSVFISWQELAPLLDPAGPAGVLRDGKGAAGSRTTGRHPGQ